MKKTSQQTKLITIPNNIKVVKLTFVSCQSSKPWMITKMLLLMQWIELVLFNWTLVTIEQRFMTKHSNNIFKYLKEGQECSQNE